MSGFQVAVLVLRIFIFVLEGGNVGLQLGEFGLVTIS